MVGATDSIVGPQLAQVAKRILVWWMDVSRDFRKGDRLELIWEPKEGQEPFLHALWIRGEKIGERRAARWQAPGDNFARWYTPDGQEVELRLEHSPINDYEQITSLLKDGRRHHGVDFKAPVGTEIVAPFDGTVIRKNWNFRGNGNCLELQDSKGMSALFLHLAEVEPGLNIGRRVKRGQVLGRSGNTGRSTAPHLHYQLERGGKVLDPFDVHQTSRAKLQTESLPALNQRFTELDRLRPGST